MKRLEILLFFGFLFFFKYLYCMKGLCRSTDPNYKRVQSIDNATDLIKSISFSPDGKNFASGSQRGQISIWECEVDKLLFKELFQAHNDSIYSLVYSPCGNFLASASRDGTLKRPRLKSHGIRLVVN